MSIGFLNGLPWFRRAANTRLIDRIHGEIMAASRQPRFYLDHGVPDTFEGRFEIFVLHAILTIRRLHQLPDPGPEIAQELTNSVFRHFDVMLRQAGVGDLSVPKRVKVLAEAFLGRAIVYDTALGGRDDLALAEAIHKYALQGEGQSEQLTAHARRLADALAGLSVEAMIAGPLNFPQLIAIDGNGGSVDDGR
jgi:cytochrome b pre-mRNA-processing protein 3